MTMFVIRHNDFLCITNFVLVFISFCTKSKNLESNRSNLSLMLSSFLQGLFVHIVRYVPKWKKMKMRDF